METHNYVIRKSKIFIFFFIFFLFLTGPTIGQTVLLSPTGDGGFENATSSFAANNWLTALPSVTRQWQVGTAAGSVTPGSKAAYVGAAANYNGASAAQVGHFYRDLTIPAGATNVLLTFYLQMPTIDNTYDYIRVFTTTTSNTPVSGTNPGAGYNMIFENTATSYASFTAMSAINLTSLAGSTVRLVFTNVSDGVAPAANPAVDNISVVYTPAAACSGTPNGGTTLSSVNPVCSGANFTLSLSGASTGTGITYQWQSSPNNSTWTNISGATVNTRSTSQTAAAYYRCQLICGVNPPGYSSALLVNMNTLANCYCVPAYATGCAADRITSFQLNTLTNNSGATCSVSPAGYSIYGTTPANQTTTLDQGGSYTATIATIAGNTNGTGVAIWIDYNDNGLFDVSEGNNNGATKFVSNTTGILVVNIPVGAPLGPHSMRVMCARNILSNALNPCTPGNANGETEDYIVTIGVATACSGNPIAGATQSSANPACYGASFTLSLTGASTLAGLTYQWQSSSDNSTWTNIGGATGSSYIATQTTATYYQCLVTCSNGGQTAVSTSLLVTVTPLQNCYCVGTYDYSCSIDYISNVTFGSINNTTTCSGSLPSNRSVYTSPNPVFYRGFSYPLSVTTDGDAEAMRAWIDYDHSFTFIAGESVLAAAAGGPPQTTSASITIPLTAQLGQTMMRVRCRYSTAVGTGAACTNFTAGDYGETEDYLITIADAPQCSGNPVAGSTVSSSSAACPTTSFTLSLTGNAIEIGLTYQWQSAPDVGGSAGTYTNVGGATNSTFTTTMASTTWYRCVITCSNGGASSNSTPIKINSAVCINISNGSSTTCSANFYDSGGPSGTYAVNENYVYTFFPNPGNQIQVAWNSFVSEAGFDFITIYDGAGTSSPVLYGPISGTLSIPTFTSTDGSGAITIQFTSDLSIVDAGWAATVSCVPNPACSGSPAASTTISSANPACYNTAFILSLSANYLFSGMTFQWQSAPDLSGVPGTFSNISGATNTTYTATQTAITWYHCVITCANSGQSTSTSNLRVTTQLCYCIPNYTTGCAADRISYFSLNTLSNNSGATCAASPPGYSVYGTSPINQTTILSPGTAYTASITVVTGNTNGTGVAIWIDYNDNGVFDNSENNNNGATKFASNTTGTLVVNVPANAPPGPHRLRVVSARNTNSNAVGACVPGNATGEAEDYTVTIGDPTASSNTPVCEGDTLRLFAIPAGATSYSWTGPNGFTSSAQNPKIANATPADAGIYSVSIVIGSSTYSPTTAVAVNASPVVSISSNAPFCSATQNLNLLSNAPTATSFTWSGPSFSSSMPNPSISSATNSQSGVYKVVVTDNNSCKDSSTATITIYALPSVGITVIGNTNICTGQTTSDLQATGAGITGSYSWSSGETTDLITVSTSGNYVVTGTDNNGCINTFSKNITESVAPATPIISPAGPITLCFNSSGIIPVTLSCTNYSTDLLWSTSEVTASILVDYSDNFNVTYTDANGCYSTSNSIAADYDFIDPTITCPANVVSCSTSPVLGSPITADNCSVNSFYNDAPSQFNLGNTNVTWTVSDYNNNTATCVQLVTVQSPSTAAAGAASNALYGEICSGSQVTLTANGGSLGTGATWEWYDGTCGSGVSVGTGTSIVLTPNPGLHQYFVRAEGACGNTACVNVSVNVITAPPSGTIHYTASITDGCVGASAVAFSVNAVAGCTYYNWTSSQSGVRFNGNTSPYQTTVPTVNVTFISLPPAGASGWSICVAGGNACGNTNTICTWVRATLSAPGSITGSGIGCPGTTANPYSTASVAGAASYQWSSTGGITISGNGAQSIAVAFSAGFVSGTLSVHGQTSCGYNGPDRTISIARAPVIPGIISGPSYPCPNGSSVYSVASVNGAADYTWTTSVPGAVVTGTSSACSIAFPAVIPAGSTVSVTANSSCPFSSPLRSKGIASGIPGVPANISGPASGQCGETGVSYSITPVALATGYNWTTTCGTIQGPNNLSGITIDWPGSFTFCTIAVTASNGCGAGIARTLNVLAAPATPASVSGNANPCAGTTENYTASSTGATSYNWTIPAGSSILGPVNGSSIILQWGSTGGSVTVQAVNACGTSGNRSLACVISCRQSQMNETIIGFNAEVYPNPARDNATVKFSTASAGQYQIEVIDVLGQGVLSTEGTAVEGVNMIDLNLKNVAKGVYMLNIMSENITQQIKMIIQ